MLYIIKAMDFYNELDSFIDYYFSGGETIVRRWFLVKQNFLPFMLCGAYLLCVTLVGPKIMQKKKPLEMRKLLVLFNLVLVLYYVILLIIIGLSIPKLGIKTLCSGGDMNESEELYILGHCCWHLYILKYVELLDTVFFILRKKQNLISFLHVFHHTSIPIAGWVYLRTEKGFLLLFPVIVNSAVHVIMYTYYAMAAMGPHMKKYLWWKKYLTLIQMVQFVFILLFAFVVVPLSGCPINKDNYSILVVLPGVFLILFYKFYKNAFKSCEEKQYFKGKEE